MPNQPDYNRLRSVTIFKDLDKNELEVVHNHVFEKVLKKTLYYLRKACRENCSI